MGLRICRSLSTDIYANLALEEQLFRQLPEGERLLLLWSNRDAVVIGRYQNPYLECDVPAIRRSGVCLARRRSGGGTVWHDLGNLCFTFMGGRADFDRRENIEAVVAVLRSLGVPAETNERLDILVEGYKVSGSAFRESGGKSLHHGTLLVDSDLSRLSGFLKGDAGLTETKGVKSVRSRVANIGSWGGGLGVEEIAEALAEGLCAGSGGAAATSLDPESEETGALIEAGRAEFRDPAWIFGASPPFKRPYVTEQGSWTLRVEGGRVAELEASDKAVPETLSRALLGADYGLLEDIAAALPSELRPAAARR